MGVRLYYTVIAKSDGLISGSQIRDYPAFLKELAHTLRPGGILLLGEGEMQLYDEQQRPVSFSETTSSWTERVFFAGYNAIKTRGGSIDAPGPPLMPPMP